MRNKIVLTGGLGNQLFQLACALAITDPAQLNIDSRIGNPRMNAYLEPEINSLVFPAELEFSSRTSDTRTSKYLGTFAFKISSKTFYYKPLQCTWIRIKNLALNFGVFLSDGVGFDSRIFIDKEFKWIFGPFHTYGYLEKDSVKKFMAALAPKISPGWLDDLRIDSTTERPIILHVRLSDYKGISELGILTSSYFEQALKLALEEFPNSRVWLFSDEVEVASELLKDSLPENSRIINYDREDAASNLQAMRFGHCYILSNSTFSWWGAYLSFTKNPKVYCPNNWFRSKPNPKMLIPNEWIRIDNL